MRTLLIGASLVAVAGLTLAACSKKDEAAAPDTSAGAAATATAPAAGQLDRPAPGKWKITSEMEGVPAKMPPVEVCYTKEQLQGDDWMKQAQGQDSNCTDVKTERGAGTITTSGTCTGQGGTKMTYEMKVSGDFNSRYVMESSTTMEPAVPGMPSPMKAKMTAERIGDC